MLLHKEGDKAKNRVVVKMKKMIMKRAKNIVTIRWMRRSCWNAASICLWYFMSSGVGWAEAFFRKSWYVFNFFSIC